MNTLTFAALAVALAVTGLALAVAPTLELQQAYADCAPGHSGNNDAFFNSNKACHNHHHGHHGGGN